MPGSSTSANADSVHSKYRLEGYDNYSYNPQALRLYRSYSWMARAEEIFTQYPEDPDEAFIFYWIAFNALYAEDSAEAQEATERSNFNAFIEKLLNLDTQQEINQVLWVRFQDEVRGFLENEFVFEPFWKYHNGVEGFDNWSIWFEKQKKDALEAIFEMDTLDALRTLFDRLYVLRNQILHGAATYRSSVNRTQVQDGTRILATLLPIFFEIMQANVESTDWGKPYYRRLYT